MKTLKRSALIALSAVSFAAMAIGAVQAQDPIELKFTTVSVPTDLHTQAMKVFADTLNESEPGLFDIQLYDSGSLFSQSGDLDALQRGNAEMAYVSFQLIADAIPQFGLFTAGYLFQNADHYRSVMNSDLGGEFKQTVSDEMGIQLLDVCYLGTRELNLRRYRDVQTPADLEGVKLRMPGSDAWLFLGEALGANPTPLPFSEVYLGLQTGTVDAQDNPLPTVDAAKFYEVTEQIVLTDHLVDGLPIAVNNQTWEQLNDAQKGHMVDAAMAACDWNNEKRYAEEDRLVAFFESEGLKVTTPDVDAFRSHVQEFYLSSERAKLWPEGWVDRINALAD
ncbi:sialic acid TRAP transporter substrate-binding protein SiaP [Devosia sp. J2-20]|jgi:TRAP-type transport system periplasmic protein|uniref:sialic acid TRAP transporter substrate-binding protein SiaP n=1 Tax=Devosia TaxID=46913 RepID=UPI0022AFEF62|nr:MULTISPECIES: sialic acid TRAP transporter substrate-binding protein SiaP [Devosia]MCZ4347927.1 sialic acid TRAP transporter substrate-binding protein SiaP [Devosia neptuniae]WDR00405.1 sialic acid TRAP transporter substrate-binding protein SiaP [Devosia sp. J2-20]|tara:strand:- start:13839 stop:14843 length:1005 start_codon:yes stop_codon:yes gene_type:complete